MDPRNESPAGRSPSLTRRAVLARAAGAAAAAAALPAALRSAEPEGGKPPATKGRVKQSVCRWCYGRIPLEELAKSAAAMGYKGIDLLGNAEEHKLVKKYGLVSTMAPGAGSIADGWNRKENHERYIALMKKNLDIASELELPNVICMSGERKGLPDDVGIANCVEGLKKVAGYAEEKKVTMCLELLNSKVDHKDYQCDHTAWGVEVMKRVGSPRLKLLYDIYHMQIMEGDIIRTIRENIQYIGHFHTGGNPGRNEIDDGQELNYRTVMKAIADLKFEGYVAQEFIPRRDPMKSLEEAFRICDV